MALDPIEIIGGLAIGEGLGGAIEDTVKPRLQNFKNSQWAAHQDVPLTPGEAAAVTAENYALLGAMATEASYSGLDTARFQQLYDITVTAPGVGELLAMLRRTTINPGNFTHGLRKAKLEPMWDTALADLANQKVSATDLAYMIVRGVLPDEGLLGLSLPTHADNLKLPAQLPLNPVTEAALTGWDRERLAAMVARSGLAMAPVMAAQANFRGILTDNDYLLTIARGDLFPAYAGPVKEASRQILTAGEYAELQLRGYLTAAERRTATQQHGMRDANSDLLYDVLGRAPSIRQTYIGLARGATYDGTAQTIPSPFLEAAERSNLRPEWYSIAYENRYSLPSAFVVRTLLTDGAIDAARGQTIFENSGWPPDLAQLVAQHYGAKAGTASDPHIVKAENQLWTTAHRSYIASEVTAATATTAIEAAGVGAASVPAILTLWGHERALIRRQLTPAQIKKALREGIVNPATGAAWTMAEAVAALEARGYDAADATVLLEE
jgi:hypothetical protein